MVDCEPVLSCVSFDLCYYINLTWFSNVKKEKKALAVAASLSALVLAGPL